MIEIDRKLIFSTHVKCYATKYIEDRCFSSLNNFISAQQVQAIYNAVILSNFNYCPLIFMFCIFDKVQTSQLTALINVLEIEAIAYMLTTCKSSW